MYFFITAYKPNTVDTCRGCVMDRWDSEFSQEMFTTTRMNQAVDFYHTHKYTSNNPRDADFDIHITIPCACMLNDETDDFSLSAYDGEISCEVEEHTVRRDQIREEIFAKAKIQHDAVLAETARITAIRAQKEKQEKAESFAKKELAELARLQSKYNPPTQ